MKTKVYSAFLILLFWSCEDTFELQLAPLPFTFVRVEFNLSLPSNQNLQLNDWIYLDGEGISGLIIYKLSENTYRVFDRACPHDYPKDCALLKVYPENGKGFWIESECEDGSQYDFNGEPIRGERKYRLREYPAYVDGNILFITSDNT